MRNIFVVLTLCVLTLTTSTVFADGYDESRRTERLGLSFYDGRPLYIAYIKVYPSLGSASEHAFELVRLRTGQTIEDMANSYDPNADQGHFGKDGKYTIYGYYSVESDGSLKLITDGSFANYPESAPNHWLSQYLLTYKPGVDSGDLGLNVADELFAMAKDIFGEFFPFFAGIFALAVGSKYFEHLAKTGVKKKKNSAIVPTRATQEYFTLEKEVDQFLLETPKTSANKDSETKETQRFLDRLAGKEVEETNSVRESYITGARWGREFSEELQESNRRLLNDFEALDDFYRERLIQEFERLSFTQEAGFLKSYRSYAYGVGDDHQNGNPFADESNFAQTPWSGSPFGGGDFEDANWLLDEEYYDSYDGAY